MSALRIDRRLETARLLAVALLLVGPSPESAVLHAQEVRGRVVERGTDRPVEGALVELRDTSGRTLARSLTGTDGTVVLQAPRPGHMRVRVKRIGFETWTSAILRLTAEERLRRDFRLPVRPVQRPSLTVEAESKCSLSPEERHRLGTLWRQIETALALTSVSRTEGELVFTVRRFRTTLSADEEKVLRDTSIVSVRRSVRPFNPPSPDSLARHGFVIGERWRGPRYYVPSPSVLRSTPFLNTHCLSVRSGSESERPESLGVTFRPRRERTLPEVRGTLWLDRETLQLQELEFRYTNLRSPADEHELGGSVHFRRLPDGRWIIERWWTRLPEYEMHMQLGRSETFQLSVERISRSGAQVLSVRGENGSLLHHRRPDP